MANKTKPAIVRLGIVALLPLLLSGCWWWGPHHDRGFYRGGYHGGPGGYR